MRLMGDFAIIHARTTFTLPDGRPGAGRYTDIWAAPQRPLAMRRRPRDALLNEFPLPILMRRGLG